MRKTLIWAGVFGIAAGVVYVAATASGTLLDPTYSQIRQHVSDLTATGAPTSADLAPPYILYNLLVVALALNLNIAAGGNRLFLLGLGLLTVNAIAGVMMVTWFAEDLGGAPRTIAGTGHVIFASVSSLAIVAGSFVYGFAFRRKGGSWRAFSPFSFLIGILFIVAAPAAIITTASDSGFSGLAERAAIAPFIVWLLGVGAFALLEGRRQRTGHVASKNQGLRPSSCAADEKKLGSAS
jgi:hypothetical membrane protein